MVSTDASFSTLYVCGKNDCAQLGVGDRRNRRSLTRVNSLFGLGVVDACVGPFHSLAIAAPVDPVEEDSNRSYTGTRVYAWGANDDGQLGKGDQDRRQTARLLYSLSPASDTLLTMRRVHQVACGLNHSLMIISHGVDGVKQVLGCGSNSHGQLGLEPDHASSQKSPSPVPFFEARSGTNIESVACGAKLSAVIDEFGHLYTFGSRQFSLLGTVIDTLDATGLSDEAAANYCAVPERVRAFGDARVHSMAFGGQHALAVVTHLHESENDDDDDDNGNDVHDGAAARSARVRVWSWGESTKHGQLGDPSKRSRAEPKLVSLEALDTCERPVHVSVACGAYHSACLLSDGRLFTFGGNFHNQLGHSAHLDECATPTSVSLSAPIDAIACGSLHTVCLLRDGRVCAFGFSQEGQLGDAPVSNSNEVSSDTEVGIVEMRVPDAMVISANGTRRADARVLRVYAGGHSTALLVGSSNLFVPSVGALLDSTAHALRVSVRTADRLHVTNDLESDEMRTPVPHQRRIRLQDGTVETRETPVDELALEDAEAAAVWDRRYAQALDSHVAGAVRVQHRWLRVFCGTWNVNGMPDPIKLDSWLHNDVAGASDDEHTDEELGEHSLPPPHIYAIAFQEMVDLSARNVARSTAADAKERAKAKAGSIRQRLKGMASNPRAMVDKRSAIAAAWEQEIRFSLERVTGLPYRRVRSHQLVGVYLCVFARQELRVHIHDIDVALVKVGMLGKVGNKGAVAVRFRFDSTTLCFVGAHLAAGDGDEKREKRSQDFETILTQMHFDRKQSNECVSLLDHQRLFFLGDLNYRIRLDRAAVLAHLEAIGEQHSSTMRTDERTLRQMFERYAALSECDELGFEMRRGRAFFGWHEAPLTFAPTYKYDVGTAHYDTSEKSRTPAWCDRVLVKGRGIRFIDYGRHEHYVSDHVPVRARLLVRVTHRSVSDEHADDAGVSLGRLSLLKTNLVDTTRSLAKRMVGESPDAEQEHSRRSALSSSTERADDQEESGGSVSINSSQRRAADESLDSDDELPPAHAPPKLPPKKKRERTASLSAPALPPKKH